MMKLNKKLAIVPGIVVAAGISLTACSSGGSSGQQGNAPMPNPVAATATGSQICAGIVGQSSIVAAQLDGQNVLTGSAPGSRMDNCIIDFQNGQSEQAVVTIFANGSEGWYKL